jgi:hypothetical protein
MKLCQGCNTKKTDIHFTGHNRNCNECHSKETRLCKKCDKEKELKQFHQGACICRECKKSYIPEKRIRKDEEIDGVKMKVCNKCDIPKQDDEFRKNRRVCKDCEKEHGRNYRRNTTKAKEWATDNKDKMSKLSSDWFQENKERICEKRKERTRKDPEYSREMSYRASLSKCVRYQKTNVYLNIDGEGFQDWLEAHFEANSESGMSLRNYGRVWCLDHVIPMTYYREYPEEFSFEFLASWYNIAPVLISVNVTKNKYVDLEQLELQKIVYNHYCLVYEREIDETVLQTFDKLIDEIKNGVTRSNQKVKNEKSALTECETP